MKPSSAGVTRWQVTMINSKFVNLQMQLLDHFFSKSISGQDEKSGSNGRSSINCTSGRVNSSPLEEWRHPRWIISSTDPSEFSLQMTPRVKRLQLKCAKHKKQKKKKLISSVRVLLSNSEHESNVCLQPTHILLSGGICSFLAVSFWVLFSAGVTVVAGLVPVTPEQQRGGFTFVHGFISQHWEGWGGLLGDDCSPFVSVLISWCAMTSAPAGGGLLAE